MVWIRGHELSAIRAVAHVSWYPTTPKLIEKLLEPEDTRRAADNVVEVFVRLGKSQEALAG